MEENIENNSEIYIYLGFYNNTYFFKHHIYNKNEFKNEISRQLYNILIKDKFIHDHNENVIIYEFDNEECNLISIQHRNKNNISKYNNYNLELFFRRLVNANKKDNDIYAIKYDYEKKVYLSYVLDNINMIDNLKDEQKIDIIIKKIDYIVTSKEIKK